MTSWRAVNRLYGELSSAEAYGAFLSAAARADWRTAREVVSATPHDDVVLRRSELMQWQEEFMEIAGEFDRALQASLAESEKARAVLEALGLQTQMTASLASQMYLAGVAAGSGDADAAAHREEAGEISEAVLGKSQREVEGFREREAAARESAADVVYGFDGACQAAGIDPDAVISIHSTAAPEVLEDLRRVSPSPNANEWRLCFAGILLKHVGDVVLE